MVYTVCYIIQIIDGIFLYQRTNGLVNAHLISGPSKSKKHIKPGKKQGQEMTLTFNTHL